MSERSIILAGIGGQGIVFATTVLAQALYRQGYYVSQLQSYGAEVRGGAVIGWVVYSEDPIECPFIDEFDIMVLLHQDGYRECCKKNLRSSFVVSDEDLVPNPPQNSLRIPMNREAEMHGCMGLTNIVALGVLSALGYVSEQSLRETIEGMKGAQKNLKALEIGLSIGRRIKR